MAKFGVNNGSLDIIPWDNDLCVTAYSSLMMGTFMYIVECQPSGVSTNSQFSHWLLCGDLELTAGLLKLQPYLLHKDQVHVHTVLGKLVSNISTVTTIWIMQPDLNTVTITEADLQGRPTSIQMTYLSI